MPNVDGIEQMRAILAANDAVQVVVLVAADEPVPHPRGARRQRDRLYLQGLRSPKS